MKKHDSSIKIKLSYSRKLRVTRKISSSRDSENILRKIWEVIFLNLQEEFKFMLLSA